MNIEALLDPLVTTVVYAALGTIAAVAGFAAYAFFKALSALRDADCRRRVLGI